MQSCFSIHICLIDEKGVSERQKKGRRKEEGEVVEKKGRKERRKEMYLCEEEPYEKTV